MVLFGALDSKDANHKESLQYIRQVDRPEYFLAGFAMFEYDIVLKSRGFTPEQRMEYYSVLMNDFPILAKKTRQLSPEVMYRTAELEREASIDYFDAGVAAESRMYDGRIVSKDPIFDKLSGVTRIW